MDAVSYLFSLPCNDGDQLVEPKVTTHLPISIALAGDDSILNARQLATIATRNSEPPLRLSDLREMYTVNPFSLRAIANLMEEQKTYLNFKFGTQLVWEGSIAMRPF